MAEEKSGGLMKIIDDYIKGYINEAVSFFFFLFKKSMKRYVMSLILTLAASISIIYGLGSFVGSFFPILPSGVSHMIVGLLFLLAARSYSKQ